MASPDHGSDALAEVVVLAIVFEPPAVDGLPTGLRSWVVVHFAR